MKTLRMLIAALLLAGATLGLAADPLAESLQKGLFEEEANHNLDAAIQAYRSVVALGNDQRKLMATAVFRLGECYRKQGKQQEASAQFELVLRDYSDQAELVQYSRQILASLGATGSVPTNSLQNVAVTSAEAEEIKNIQGMIKNSPDLIDAPGKDSRTPLQNAAVNGQLLVAQFLLDNHAAVDKRGNSRRTALHDAAMKGHKAMVELLVAHHANVNVRDLEGATPLALASANGFKAVVQVLLKNGADVNAKNDENFTPLHAAARGGHLETIELLLANGADINAKAKYGGTPLYSAIAGSQMGAVRLLVAKKADVHAGPDGRPLLTFAVEKEQADIVQLLLDQGADANAEGAFYISNSSFNSSVLNFAVELGNQGIVDALLKSKAEVNHKDSRGARPLLCAVARKRLAIAELLLARGAEVDARGSWQAAGATEGYANLTPLLLAVSTDQREMAELLLRNKADLNKPWESDWRATPLQIAVNRGDVELVKLLLANGAEVNGKDKNGRTPIQNALDTAGRRINTEIVRAKAKEIVQLLREHGASEDILRRPYITLSRKAREYSKPLLSVDSHEFNQHSLFEVIAMAFARGAPTEDELAFPDFQHLTIDRLTAKEGAHQLIPVNLDQLLSADDPKDLDLEWGDTIEIPELDHPINQIWLGLSPEQVERLQKSLKRQVRLVVKGQTNFVDLVYTGKYPAPGMQGLTRATAVPNRAPLARLPRDNPALPPTDFVEGAKSSSPAVASSPTNQPAMVSTTLPANEPHLTLSSFWLSEVVRNAGLLRASSDMSRIKVTHAQLGSSPAKSVVFVLETPLRSNDLWLHDGDVITVPEKE